jgi:hypothetical protein
MDWNYLKDRVKRRVPHATLQSMYRYVQANPPALWGLEKPQNFLKAVVYYTLYIDLYNVGIGSFVDDFRRGLAFKLSRRSVHHNVQNMRRTLAGWGRNNINLGTPFYWNRIAHNVPRHASLQVVPRLHTVLKYLIVSLRT